MVLNNYKLYRPIKWVKSKTDSNGFSIFEEILAGSHEKKFAVCLIFARRRGTSRRAGQREIV